MVLRIAMTKTADIPSVKDDIVKPLKNKYDIIFKEPNTHERHSERKSYQYVLLLECLSCVFLKNVLDFCWSICKATPPHLICVWAL